MEYLIGIFVGIIWLVFFTWLIFWGMSNNNVIAIFFGVLFTGIFWGLLWVLISNFVINQKKVDQLDSKTKNQNSQEKVQVNGSEGK